MEKVYIIFNEYMMDEELFSNVYTTCYKTKEDALKYMEEMYKEDITWLTSLPCDTPEELQTALSKLEEHSKDGSSYYLFDGVTENWSSVHIMKLQVL